MTDAEKMAELRKFLEERFEAAKDIPEGDFDGFVGHMALTLDGIDQIVGVEH